MNNPTGLLIDFNNKLHQFPMSYTIFMLQMLGYAAVLKVLLMQLFILLSGHLVTMITERVETGPRPCPVRMGSLTEAVLHPHSMMGLIGEGSEVRNNSTILHVLYSVSVWCSFVF